MDSDSDPRFVDTQAGNYIYAENILNGDSATPGAVLNLPGEVGTYVAETEGGTNHCIGSVEDKVGNTLISFWYNTSGFHNIQRWFKEDNHFEFIAYGSWLDFSLERRIHSAYVLDGKYLRWTDTKVDGTEIVGNEPRWLNMERASLYLKPLSYEFYAGFDGQEQFASGNQYTFSLTTFSGTNIIDPTIITFPDDTYLSDVQGGLNFIAEQLEAAEIADYITIDRCPCKLVITITNSDQKLTYTYASSARFSILVPLNHYVAPLSDFQPFMAAVVKAAPTCAPMPTYINDSSVAYNNVRDGCFQFRVRYRYFDGEIGPWSAISETALNNALNAGPIESLNAIRVVFTDGSMDSDRLNDPNWLAMIRYVDVAFRDGANDTFKLIKSIPVCEIGATDQWIVFKNDELYQTIPSDDASITGNVQVLANDHHVPKLVASMAPIAAEDGNVRETLMGTLEGYDCPDCMDVSLEAVTYDNPDLIDIIGTVEIISHPDFPNTDIGYSNYALGGFVVYLAGTPFYGISDNPADGTGTGAFRIKNVPVGQYTMRVASYQCRYGNDMGPRYNLLNGLEWQKTSSPMVDCAGSVADNTFKTERILDLYGFVGTEFDLDSEPGYGTIQVQNAQYGETTTPGTYMKLAEVYALDNNGAYAELDDRTGATSVERIGIDFHLASSLGVVEAIPFENTYADHNGYSFSVLQYDLTAQPNFRPVIIAWGGDDSLDPGTYHVYASGENGWKGLFSDEPTEIEDKGTQNIIPLNFLSQNGSINFAFNHDPDWTTANSYTLHGQCVDQNNVPIPNVVIWMFTNGRTEKTDALGQYAITTYGYGTPSRFAIQELRPAYLPDAPGAYIPTPASDTEAFDFVDGQATPSTFVYDFAGGIPWRDRFIKAGGVYKVAGLYEDDPGRACCVIPWGTIRVPFHTELNSYLPQQIKYTIAKETVPPVWAKKYRVLITRDSYYLTYRHLPVANVKYAQISPTSRLMTITSYAANNATHILLGIKTKIPNDPSAVPLLNMFRDTAESGYHGKFGDRVRYMLDETLTPLFSDRVIEVAVEGELIDGNDYYVVIPYTEINREIKKSFVFEFFTPKGYEEEIYYETGSCFILEDSPLRHPASIQEQHLPNQLTPQPAIGIIAYGDTYWRMQGFELNDGDGASFVAENETKNDYVNHRCEDVGRPRAYDPSDEERFYFNRIRFSGLYVPDSNINDLCNYGALDMKALNRTYGPIMWGQMVGTVLLCICQNRTQPVYVGKGRVIDVSGDQLVGRADAILNIANETMAAAGTLNPESVAVHHGHAYWWDLKNGKVWRYGQDGIQLITRGKQNYFRRHGDDRIVMTGTQNFVKGGIDRRYNQYFLTFDEGGRPGPENSVILIAPDTLAFDINKQGWSCHFVMYPEAYGVLNDEFFAFAANYQASLFQDTREEAFNLLLNESVDSLIKFPVNHEPQREKDWLNIRIMAYRKWYCDAISIPAGGAYPSGMSSILPANRFAYKESSWCADFLRDMTDPHKVFTDIVDANEQATAALLRGRTLKGYVAIVTIKPEDSALSQILYRTDTEYFDSQNTP